MFADKSLVAKMNCVRNERSVRERTGSFRDGRTNIITSKISELHVHEKLTQLLITVVISA